MKNRLLFLGPPGAGKGTQADLLCKKQDLSHLSTGDLLRSEVSLGTRLGQQASDAMNRGELVSDDLVLSIVEKRLLGLRKGWILDGFPRNVLQAESLELLLKKIDQPIQAVVSLDVNDELLIERLLSRGRIDDSESVIRHRLEVYKEKTAPLVEYYDKQGLLLTVAAEGDIQVIAGLIENIIS